MTKEHNSQSRNCLHYTGVVSSCVMRKCTDILIYRKLRDTLKIFPVRWQKNIDNSQSRNCLYADYFLHNVCTQRSRHISRNPWLLGKTHTLTRDSFLHTGLFSVNKKQLCKLTQFQAISIRRLQNGYRWKLMSKNTFDFKLSPCSECCILSFWWFPSVWILCADVSVHPVPSK